MSSSMKTAMAAALIGALLGVVGAFLVGEPIDAASFRFWAMPMLGSVSAFGATVGALRWGVPKLPPAEPLSHASEPAAMPPALWMSPNDEDTPVYVPNSRLTYDELTKKLARKVSKIAQLRVRLARASTEFERLKSSYRDLYHNAPVMYFGLDALGRFVTFNDTLLNTLGYKREDLQGQPYAAAIPAQPPAKDQPLFPTMPGQSEGQKTRWRHKNGSQMDVWIRSMATVDDSGQLVRWRCSALDLTERNRLADELRARGDELERMNARLRRSNAELEQFTHVVSHDLKEPLRTLRAYSQLLVEEYAGQLGVDGFQYINHMMQASARLERLVEDLLSLSQVGRGSRDNRSFNLNEPLATVRRELSDLIQRRNAKVLSEGPLPDVVGDPSRITQLLANLIGNGLKYNQNPEPTVTIGQVEASDADAGHAVCYVRDNGIGIAPQFHEQVFDIFRRLHRHDEYEGTGAGLAICKKIVETHGGKIWVESQPGKGATFFFTLPKCTGHSSGHDASALPHIGGEPTPRHSSRPQLRGARILLVEDMYEIGTLIKKLGQRSGLQFTWFTTAEEAWSYLQTESPEFILLDKNLPGMDGLELCRRIRNTLKSEVPIALFSQEQRLDDLRILRKAGANFFISKELLSRPAIWQEKLRELLTKSLAKAKANDNGAL
jgi:PAS domain S-box-containing protein